VKRQLQPIIAAFGAGIGKTFNIDKLRYDKILIMCFTGDTKVKAATIVLIAGEFNILSNDAFSTFNTLPLRGKIA
jgi:hypothetical protein